MKIRTATLSWSRFSRMSDARAAFWATPCVYAQTDRAGKVIRVGKAEKGLNSRYHGGEAYSVDAAMHRSRNLVFVAAVPQALCVAVEDQLIWQHRSQLEYNNQGKLQEPKMNISLIHKSDVPGLKGSK